MTFISEKIINRKKRYYLEKSVRLPNGKIKKISVYLRGYDKDKNYSELKDYNKILEEKVKKIIIDAFSRKYKTSHVFDEKNLKKLEEIRLGYKKIISKLTKSQLKDVLDKFTINFTYESNAIEGNSLTLKDVTFIILEDKVLKGKDLREIYETLNTRKAIEWIFFNKLKINHKNIIKLHEILVENTGISTGYKKIPNFLIGRNIKTTLPERVEEEMDKLIEWYNKVDNIHPLQKAAIFHGKFEKIHPFEDGNGRVGRLLINIMLLSTEYSPLIIRKTQRMRYFHALEAFDNNHYDNLYRFLFKKYKDTYNKFFKIYVKYI
nr:Fic family protein [Candidatus Woesearchaeota archaeon]